MHERFSGLIATELETAVAEGIIPPIDTAVAGMAWFGALNEVVMRWLMAEPHARLEDAYPTLRAILLRSVGIPEARIATLQGGTRELPRGSAGDRDGAGRGTRAGGGRVAARLQRGTHQRG